MRETRVGRTLLVLTLAAAAPRLLADSAWTIPGIVHATGLNGTHFVSDLTVTNPAAAPANVTLSFFPGSSSPKNLTLNPGQTVVYSDVAGVTFGVSGGAGALSVSSDQPLLVRAKTYNTAASGTYGVALPVITSDRLLAPGDVGDSLWISQDASGNSGYRTNIAVVFPDASGGAAMVTVYDADGNAKGSQDFSLDAAGLQQFSVGSFAGAVSVGRAQIAVTRGHAAGYAVVVDNVTGDSSLFSFEDLPGGIQDVLVNGVARANGRNGAFFRTDGRFYNPTDTDATVTVAFHASGNANPSPQSAQFVVPAGKIRDVVDVLNSLLSLPVGSAGALRFQSNWPVAILCRTSNVDPFGVRPGTFGSQQEPVPLLSFVNSADAGAAVTGIRQDAAFRTNVGFAAGADGASYTLTLQDASGATVATTSASLGTFGWTQPGIQDLFPTTTIPQNASLQVKVTAGSVDVFDSSIDNLSGDPVVTPIAPLPVAIPSSATIGPAGGSIRSDDGRLTLRVPAGALASNVAFSWQTNTSSDVPQAIGASYTLTPGGLSFAKPVTLLFSYGTGDVDGSAPGWLGLAFKNGNIWYVATGGSVNVAARTLAVPIGSTTPASTAAPPNRRAADASSEDWGPFQGLQLRPGKTGTPTGGKKTLALWSSAPSSSSLAPSGPAPVVASKAANDLVTAWYVNGVFLGNTAEGTVADVGQGIGHYTAPKCLPVINPVVVAVKVSYMAGGTGPYVSQTLAAKVRIVPRDWQFQTTWIHNIGCPGIASDYVEYKAGFFFSLDDDLNISTSPDDFLTQPSTRTYGADPGPCPPYIKAKRTGDNDLTVDFLSGWYDPWAFPDKGLFNTVFTTTIPIMPGYSMTLPTGQTDTFAPIKAVVPPMSTPFVEGKSSMGVAAGPAAINFAQEISPLKTAGCP